MRGDATRPPPPESPQDQQLAGENLITPNSHTHTYWDSADGYRRIYTLAKFARRRMQLLGERESASARGYKGGGGLRVYEYCSPDLLIIDAQTQEVT
jgi:hypothetical protein